MIAITVTMNTANHTDYLFIDLYIYVYVTRGMTELHTYVHCTIYNLYLKGI